ncbi:diacylglycerol kinase family protein [Oceanobacillus manasiensis]|uniref:diacylglycerol kinase family protein n=1 Tax=Oceanobacillus manasiensis TaxID=586413 RepID=UPI0005A66734|nr:diacylglycerol kinase family protein [Oceanobacillus manasiensis]
MKGNRKSIGFKYAWNGVLSVVKTERNFRIHLLAAFIVICAGIIMQLSQVEWLFIVIAIGSVLTAECLNSAVEKMLDYLKPEIHPKAKVVKDLSAGAVLLTVLMSVVVGLIVFIPKIAGM